MWKSVVVLCGLVCGQAFGADPIPLDIRAIYSQEQIDLLHGLYTFTYCHTVNPKYGIKDPIIRRECERIIYRKVYTALWKACELQKK